MVGKELITKELLEDWRGILCQWAEVGRGWGANSVIVFFDDGEREFKPLFVFPEQDIAIESRNFLDGNKPVAALQLGADCKLDDTCDEALFAICHFFDEIIEN